MQFLDEMMMALTLRLALIRPVKEAQTRRTRFLLILLQPECGQWAT